MIIKFYNINFQDIDQSHESCNHGFGDVINCFPWVIRGISFNFFYLTLPHGMHSYNTCTKFTYHSLKCTCHIHRYISLQTNSSYSTIDYSAPVTSQSSQASGVVPLTSTLGVSDSQEPSLVQSMTQLLQAQMQMLAAQAQAATVQSLSPISKFSGEDAEQEAKSFKHWLELFEEWARLAAWPAEQKLYHGAS